MLIGLHCLPGFIQSFVDLVFGQSFDEDQQFPVGPEHISGLHDI